MCYTSEGHRILPKVVRASCYSLLREQRAKLVSHIRSLNLEIQDGTDVPEDTLVSTLVVSFEVNYSILIFRIDIQRFRQA